MTSFYGFEEVRFVFEGKAAVVVLADPQNRTDKWLLKTEYFGAFPELEVMMLKEGYNLAHVDNTSRWCLLEDTERQARFCKHLTQTYGFADKCVPVGMSCGGMQAVYLAAAHPELIAALYLDAPVINFLSCPACFGRSTISAFEEFLDARGMTATDLLSFRDHPLDRFDAIPRDIPIILVSGDADTIVPFDENGVLLYNYAKAHQMPIELHIKPGGDHHPHGLPDQNEIIADFIMEHYPKSC